MISCTACGSPLTAAPPRPGTITPAWDHAGPPGDGHLPGVPPLTVTYRETAGWWDADSPEVPGMPVRGARSLDEARSVVRELLRLITPPRPVIERTGDA